MMLKRGDIVVYVPTGNMSNPAYKGCVGLVVSVDPTTNNAYGQPAAYVDWLFLPPSEARSAEDYPDGYHHVAANLHRLGNVLVGPKEAQDAV